MARADVRQHLLDAAAKLFYRHGINGVGIDAILAEAQASSRSLYQHFGSKDGLARAFLERRDAQWLTWFRDAIAAAGPDPAARLLAMFEALETWFQRPDYRGCAFINAAGEVADASHELRRLAAAHKRALFRIIRDTVDAGRFDDAEGLARALFLLVEGAIVTALVLSAPAAARHAKRAATRLIAAHRRPVVH
jgi:AcrR family transcriptional regulator